ncbi:MAG: hypothetical protein P4M13_10670 [Alphaproteobacteria bacterium]|nr:hypothetical protein [Alphaproteobacteria bacterium]
MTEAPKSKPQAPSEETGREKRPLQVRHGQKIMDAIQETHQDTRETHLDVIATKADTAAILSLLSPAAEETDPVMEALERIERLMLERFDALNLRLTRIEQQLATPE